MWILTRSDTNQAVQLLEMARGLKFCILEVEVLYYPSSENKGADQLPAQLICIFVFAYAKRGFLTTWLKSGEEHKHTIAC